MKLTSYLLILLIFLSACSQEAPKDSVLINYSYKKTRLLVNVVDKAANILRNKGIKALEQFDQSLSYEEIYLYLYKCSDAHCLYHGEDSTKEGKSITEQRDYLGKPIHYLILEALEDEDNPDAWVHFNWPRPDDIFPTWKSSCHRKVILENGEEAYLGAGIYGKVSESEFIRISVDNAAELIREKDTNAIPVFQMPHSEFTFFDSFIFIYDTLGNAIIDPTYKDGSNINLRDFKDASNHRPFNILVINLRTSESAWGQIQYKDPASMNLKKKMIYARRETLNGKSVIVGSMLDSPKSVWFN